MIKERLQQQAGGAGEALLPSRAQAGIVKLPTGELPWTYQPQLTWDVHGRLSSDSKQV